MLNFFSYGHPIICLFCFLVPNANSEYLRCLSEVGEKLYMMEKQEEPPDFAWQNCPTEQPRPQEPESDGRGRCEMDATPTVSSYDAFVKNVPVANSVELDPVEKVAQWQQNKAQNKQGGVFLPFIIERSREGKV